MSDASIPGEERVARLKFLSSPDFIEALSEEFESDQLIESSEVREETDPSNLALDLDAVSSIIAIVSFAVVDGPIVPKIRRALERTRPREVVLKSVGRTVRIEFSDDLTDDEVRELMRRAVELT
jgi:hypothetical protein